MARGISAFYGYTVRKAGGLTFYCCPACSYNVRRTGNALGGASKCKGLVRRHLLEKHPEHPESVEARRVTGGPITGVP